ncbi:MAG TPA: SGNH/GDSL hydrolase family protein [Vicinamibacteria bacterium]|nr:SGNH/GDSL hydrolase family protein [Vicinamibacteria bacterium]
MTRPRRLAAAAAALAALAPGAPPVSAQTPTPGPISFSAYYSIGDSLAAGYVNNSLVETHQANSVPALLARQAGVADFQQPLVTEPGIPPEYVLRQLVPTPIVGPKAVSTGAPRNSGLGRSFNNLAVPGATVADALGRTGDNGGFHDIVLRGRGAQVAQAVAARPSFVTVWIGNNDLLGAVIAGRALEGVTVTPAAEFRAAFEQVIAALQATGARVVAANLPDVTGIPYATTLQRVVVNAQTGQPLLVDGQPVPLLGPAGPLPPGTLVTLAAGALLAQGDGIPTTAGGRGTPLPDEVILDPGEVSFLQDRVNANNQAIAEICQAAGVPVVDVNAFYRAVLSGGYVVGGVVLTNNFLTGGVISLDGVHPTDLGYAILANEWIRVINQAGGELDPVNLGPYTGLVTAAAGN